VDKAKLNYVLDAVIALAFLLSAATGVAFMVMGEGGYQGGRNPGFATSFIGLSRGTWSDLHTLGSLIMIAGVAVHIALHWRWIVCVSRRLLPSLPGKSAETACEVVPEPA
jgi:hypothetical protein